MPQRFAARLCNTKTAGISRARPAPTRVAADSGSIMMRAMSLVATHESAAVVSTSASARDRGLPNRAMTVRAARSKAPMSLRALATANTQNRQPSVFPSKYPR